MKRYFIKKAVTAGAFVVVLGTGFVMNMRNSFTEIKSSISNDLKEKKEVSTIISNVDGVINENAFAKYVGIDTYGYLQRLLLKNEENDFEVIKDNTGSLHLTYFGTGPKDVSMLADRMEFLEQNIKNKNTKLIYVNTPDKVIPGVTKFESGLPYNYANETADNFLADLKERNISSIDYRETILDNGINPYELFFKTDHHWRIETAFWAFTELANKLSTDYGMKVDNLDYYTDLANYNVLTYEDSYVGSLGRKTGTLYSGVDDFSLIYPKFETDYTFTATMGDQELNSKGIFEEALLNLSNIRYSEEKYDAKADKYSTYLHGNQGIVHVKNNKVTDGPKILLVKDSYMVPVAAFLSTICSDVYMVDPRYYEENIVDYINSVDDLDYVLVSFIPQDLTEEFFRFGGEDASFR